MWLGNWQRKYPCCHYPLKLILGQESNLTFLCTSCMVSTSKLGCEATRETMPHLLLPSDPPFSQRKEDGLNSWTVLKQEYCEITRSNHALKIRYERATQCSRKNEPMRAASTVKPTYYILLKISLMLTHAQCFLFLALGEILGRCFTLVRFMSLWPWECPWE